MVYQAVNLALLASLPSRTRVRVVGEVSASGHLLHSATGQAELTGLGHSSRLLHKRSGQEAALGGCPAGPAEVWGELLGQRPARLKVPGLYPLERRAGGPELEPGGALPLSAAAGAAGGNSAQVFDGTVRVMRCGDALLGQGPDERMYRLDWPQAECGTFAVVGWVTEQEPATLQVCRAQPLAR